MTKKKIDKEAERTPSSPGRIVSTFKDETVHFVIGLVLIIFSVYLLLAFSSFLFTGATNQSIIDSGSSADFVAISDNIKDYAGPRRVQLTSCLINNCFGISSFSTLVSLVVTGLKLTRIRIVRLWKWFTGCALLLIWFSVFFGFALMDHYQDPFICLEGMHGCNVSRQLVSQVGVPGIQMILLIMVVCFFIYIGTRIIIWSRKLFTLSLLKRQKEEEERETAEEGAQEFTISQPQKAELNLRRTYKQTPPPAPVMDIRAEEPKEGSPANAPEPDDELFSADEAGGVTAVSEPTVSDVVPPAAQDELPGGDEPGLQVEAATSEEEYQGPEQEPYNLTKDLENYRFPTIDLMEHLENDDPTINMDEQNANKDRIINTLCSFGIEISTIKATVGPTVALYRIIPEQSMHISKVRGLEDDIVLSLSAGGIRIIASIPGKGTIGIEAPNKNPRIVSDRSVIESGKFQESKFDLPIIPGKTTTNEVFASDPCKMSHALAAGATGQDKPVGLNAITTSLLYKKRPAELKFVLVDLKKVEFNIYLVIENHFLAKPPDRGEPIITGVTKVVQALNSACVEIDTRYDLLKMAHAHNVKEYSGKFISRRLNPEKGYKFMSCIVVVVNEFRDSIMTAGEEVEPPIARIVQLIRAVGIHMIIATQRLTTNITIGTVRADFPARTAFRVFAAMDSRTTLGRSGANRPIGKGGTLSLQSADPVRTQCVFINTSEVEEITKSTARQQSYPTPFFLPGYMSEDSGNEMGDIDMGCLDPLFEDAAHLMVIHQQGSTSLIQRKFAIGYNRAGRIMDQLEKAEIVGPTRGSKTRDVPCIDDNDLEMRLNNLQ